MITIGIDPGIEKTGVGIVELKNNKLSLLDSRLIKTSSQLTTSRRLNLIYHELKELISLYSIQFAAVEKLFFAKNIKTAMVVSEARGIILLALEQSQIEIYEYTPLQVKQALIGYGRADKKQVQQLVKIILNLKELPKQDDVADGMALAITHFHTYKTLSKIIQSSK